MGSSESKQEKKLDKIPPELIQDGITMAVQVFGTRIVHLAGNLQIPTNSEFRNLEADIINNIYGMATAKLEKWGDAYFMCLKLEMEKPDFSAWGALNMLPMLHKTFIVNGSKDNQPAFNRWLFFIGSSRVSNNAFNGVNGRFKMIDNRKYGPLFRDVS